MHTEMIDTIYLCRSWAKRENWWFSALQPSATDAQVGLLVLMLDNAVKEDSDYADLVCEACDSGHDVDKLLLCDMCDTGYHLYCLQPPLKEVPDEDWFCSKCTV
jgi:bromodomain adjacent to zinc finger domain protein 1A